MNGRPNILIVDDREQNLFVLEKTLKSTGANIVRALNGDAALRAALKFDFALAILDVQMPGMDGYELAEFIREDEKTRSLPIIFLSAVCSDEYHVFRGYEAGAVDYIVKPYEPTILINKVEVFLELYRQKTQLENYKENLEELVEERTQELEKTLAELEEEIAERKKAEKEKMELEMWLRQSQKLESIGTLAAGVAHEINNPLMGIISYAELINERVEEESLKEFSEGIIEEGIRVGKIVKNLLSFARQDKESHSPAYLVDIINVSLSLLGAVLRKCQIKLEMDIPDDLPKIRCRSQQIEQVIINLLTNARDALNKRYQGYHENKVIKISVKSFEKEGIEWIRTTVEDHGSGISPELMERIFDPFFTTKSRDEGTGLGLSVSYGIIREHKGELSVESEEGKFARFHIDLRVNNGWTLKGVDDAYES